MQCLQLVTIDSFLYITRNKHEDRLSDNCLTSTEQEYFSYIQDDNIFKDMKEQLVNDFWKKKVESLVGTKYAIFYSGYNALTLFRNL